MFLGIEIGGTKLQVAVGSAENSTLTAIHRADVCVAKGAEGIRQQIAEIASPLIAKHAIQAVGIGFGGPVDVATGRTIKSHHVSGWDDYPLADWTRQTLGVPACVGNDSDLAGLGEAVFGAGRDKRVVFYTNVGSGIGGALVIDRRVYIGGAGVASELGHIRVGPQSETPQQIVELASSGWAIAAAARADHELAAHLEREYGCQVEQITTKHVAEAAKAGTPAARTIFYDAVKVYGWAIAQMITLLSPQVVVIGGGVPLVGEKLFFAPLRDAVARYAFPPLRDTYKIVPAELGEEVVLHGALALARGQAESGNTKSLFIP